MVQPVSGVGLVGLALYSHFFLRERLQLLEWLAVALAGAGTLGLGATAGEEASGGAGGGGGAAGAAEPHSALRMVGTLVGLAAGVGAVSLLRQRARARRGRGSSISSSAAMYGLQAGACFGLSAASCRTGGWAGGWVAGAGGWQRGRGWEGLPWWVLRGGTRWSAGPPSGA